MEINCPNCNKTFIIKDDLIPVNGRLLQCGSCNNKWFFIKKKIEENKKEDLLNEIKVNKSFLNDQKLTNKSKETKKIEEFSEKKDSINNKKKINLLGLFIVTIITAIAVIILLDTFKTYISIIYPEINFFLNSLYETLKDINLFFKDLIR